MLQIGCKKIWLKQTAMLNLIFKQFSDMQLEVQCFPELFALASRRNHLYSSENNLIHLMPL